MGWIVALILLAIIIIGVLYYFYLMWKMTFRG
jgi:hypothetical protein